MTRLILSIALIIASLSILVEAQTSLITLYVGTCASSNVFGFGLIKNLCTNQGCYVYKNGTSQATTLYETVQCINSNVTWVSNISTIYPNAAWVKIETNTDVNCNMPTGFSFFAQLDQCITLDGVTSLKLYSGRDKTSFTFRNYTGTTCDGTPGYVREIETQDNNVGACYYQTNLTTLPIDLNGGGVRYSILSAQGLPATNSAAASTAFIGLATVLSAIVFLLV